MVSCLTSAFSSVLAKENTQLISNPLKVSLSLDEENLVITEIDASLVSIHAENRP